MYVPDDLTSLRMQVQSHRWSHADVLCIFVCLVTANSEIYSRSSEGDSPCALLQAWELRAEGGDGCAAETVIFFC